jgi:hypothetical protein
LTESSRAQVWKDFLSAVPPGVDQPDLDDEHIAQLAKIPLNGREVSFIPKKKKFQTNCLTDSFDQIKNTISCAFSMSRESGEALTVDRVQEVLSILVDDWSVDE